MQRDLQVHQDLLAYLAVLVCLDPLDPRGRSVYLEMLGLRVSVDLLAKKDLRDLVDHQEHKELKESRENQALLGKQELMDRRVVKDLLVLLGNQEFLGLKDRREGKGNLVQEEELEAKERLVFQDLQDPRE